MVLRTGEKLAKVNRTLKAITKAVTLDDVSTRVGD
jgi:hypothetical protein